MSMDGGGPECKTSCRMFSSEVWRPLALDIGQGGCDFGVGEFLAEGRHVRLVVCWVSKRTSLCDEKQKPIRMPPGPPSRAEGRCREAPIGQARLPPWLSLERSAVAAGAGTHVDRSTKVDLSQVLSVNSWMRHLRQQGIEQQRRTNEEADAKKYESELSASASTGSTMRPEASGHGSIFSGCFEAAQARALELRSLSMMSQGDACAIRYVGILAQLSAAKSVVICPAFAL